MANRRLPLRRRRRLQSELRWNLGSSLDEPWFVPGGTSLFPSPIPIFMRLWRKRNKDSSGESS
uniref:Serine hydroxymethyltransferase n=1 Tax=Rhizophora mucronata TaxID=61149 RepID=A0A2P2IKT6_RHIMU